MLHTCLLNTNLIKIKLIQTLYNLNHIDFKTCQFRIYLHSTTALWNSHLLTLHRFLKDMSLSWHFLVMPKIVSHPSFSSELNNLFPMLSSEVLHFLTISSSLGSKTRFNVHSAGQTLVSTSCLDSVVCRRRGFSPCAALTLITTSPALILHPVACGAVCISQDRDFPWQDPTTVEDLFTGYLTESTWLLMSQILYFEVLVCSWFKRFR